MEAPSIDGGASGGREREAPHAIVAELRTKTFSPDNSQDFKLKLKPEGRRHSPAHASRHVVQSKVQGRRCKNEVT